MTTQTFTSGQILTAAQMTTLQSNSGLQLIKSETAVSSGTSATADNVFTSAYTNYLVMINFNTSTNNALRFKLRAAGVSTTDSNYNRQELLATTTVVAASQSINQTSFQFDSTTGNFKSAIILNINNPQIAQPTSIISQLQLNTGNYTTGSYVFNLFGNHATSTAYDGIELLVSTGTFTGNYTIYGYGKTV